MSRKTQTPNRETPSRREALRRLACASVAAYMVPEVLFVSAAYAGGSKPSKPNPVEPDAPIEAEMPESTAVEPPAAQERTHIEEDRDDDVARESCNTPSSNRSDRISISRSDLTRSQDAIQAGTARPLDEIWGSFTESYDGRVIGVEFLGQRRHTRYRFRAISATGRLETVTISAQTGTIEKIVGCG